MSKPKFQIDLKPISLGQEDTSYFMNLYWDGDCIQSIVSNHTAYTMAKEGIVHQVSYQVKDENGVLQTKQYPNGVDGAGVKYTSKVYELNEFEQ